MADQSNFAREVIAAMGAAVVNTNNIVSHLAGTLEAQAQGGAGYRELKAKKELTKIRAHDARSLMQEFTQLDVNLEKFGVSVQSEAAYRQLRAALDGDAIGIVNLALEEGPGRLLKDQSDAAVATKASRPIRDMAGAQVYIHAKNVTSRNTKHT